MTPYYDVHAGNGPPMLMVHGFLSARSQWLPNLEAFKSFCTPVVLELWGHGRSPAPEDPNAYRVQSYIKAFEDIRRTLRAETWFLCGQSFGAGLTLRYALEHPDRVQAQVFTNSVSALSPPGTMSGGEAGARADALEQGGLAAIEALPFHPRHAKRFAPEVKTALLHDAAMISPRGIANAMRYTAPELSVAMAIDRITVPTLLVNGLWEKSFQPLRDAVSRSLPVLRIADIEAGHSVNLEAPEAFNTAVRDFVEASGS
ncbi:(E)-2-((N-methylformamido)methylene)succinate hydrolase [Alphaproteobacteria bacterium SO-S41]|nr:(E)-2-((N-methylformamido)methylene)succinate hydrolase [Alphaproteobacteria bacterium SO-S41]